MAATHSSVFVKSRQSTIERGARNELSFTICHFKHFSNRFSHSKKEDAPLNRLQYCSPIFSPTRAGNDLWS